MATNTLETLPNKLLNEILEALEPERLVVRPDAQPQASSADGQARIEYLNNLRNLCLVSKKLAQVARRGLYSQIVVSTPVVLVRLYRTLLENPYLGNFVDHLNLEVAMHADDNRYVEFDFTSLNEDQRSGILEAQKYDYKVKTINGDHKATCFLYLEILKQTPNLLGLCLNLQPIEVKGEANQYYPQAVYGNCLQPFASNVRTNSDPGWVKVKRTTPILPKLRQLLLLGNPAAPYAAFPAPLAHHFTRLGGLTTLMCHRDDGKWWVNDAVWARQYAHNKISTTITSLRLHDSACIPYDIYCICTLFPALKSLHISTDAELASRRERQTRIRNKEAYYLSDGLAMLTDLKALTLNLHYHFDARQWLSRTKTLNLTRLTSLRELRAPVKFFIAPTSRLYGPARVFSPETVLPPNLVGLTLWADEDLDFSLFIRWDMQSIFRVRYDVAGFLASLERILYGPDNHFHHLLRVFYKFRTGDIERHMGYLYASPDSSEDVAMRKSRVRSALSKALRLTRVDDDDDRDDGAVLKEAFGYKEVWFWSRQEEMIPLQYCSDSVGPREHLCEHYSAEEYFRFCREYVR